MNHGDREVLQALLEATLDQLHAPDAPPVPSSVLDKLDAALLIVTAPSGILTLPGRATPEQAELIRQRFRSGEFERAKMHVLHEGCCVDQPARSPYAAATTLFDRFADWSLRLFERAGNRLLRRGRHTDT